MELKDVEIKAFNRWSTNGIELTDEGLKRYVNLTPRLVPKTGAKYSGQRFYKSRTFIIERLINKIMVAGHRSKKHKITSGFMTGKGVTAYKIVEDALSIIERKTGTNPIAVFVKALENGATREEIVNIEYGGARYTKAVDCAPQRRVDLALRFFTQGAYTKSFNSKKGIRDALADEILAAYNLSQNSFAVSKKLELERQADASR